MSEEPTTEELASYLEHEIAASFWDGGNGADGQQCDFAVKRLRDLQAERDRLRNKLSYFYECQQCGDLLRESEVGGIGDHTRFTVDLNGEPAREQCGPCHPVDEAANARKEGE